MKKPIPSIHSKGHIDRAYDTSRSGGRSALTNALMFPYEEEPTVLTDTSTGVPGRHTDPTDRVEDWEQMTKDDMHIPENAGNPYDEAVGPPSGIRRPAANEWEPYDTMDAYNRFKGRD